MVNHIGRTLSRLIKERAYLGGDAKFLKRKAAMMRPKVVAVLGKYAAVRAERRKVLSKIEALDREIAEKAGVPLTGIRSIIGSQRVFAAEHGSINAALVEILKNAGGPITTPAIVSTMVQRFPYPMHDWRARDKSRHSMTRHLRRMVKLGIVERLHDPNDRAPGIWLWKGR